MEHQEKGTKNYGFIVLLILGAIIMSPILLVVAIFSKDHHKDCAKGLHKYESNDTPGFSARCKHCGLLS